MKNTPHIIIHLPGVIGDAKGAKTELESWSCIINDAMFDITVCHINQYISSITDKFSHERDANFTDKIEIKAFIGLLYLAGVLHSNRQNLKELWGTDGFGVDLFHTVMNLRFKFLIRCLRFDNKNTREERKIHDKIAPIREIFTLFVENCKKHYSSGQNVTIDEKLEGFRGKCSFKQFIPSKPNKYGIKIHALADARVFCSVNLEIYAGKQPDGKYFLSNKPTDIVMRLAEPIFNSGHNITADNWFSSIELVNLLKPKKLSYVGTLRKNQPQLPPAFVTTRGRKVKSSYFGFNKNWSHCFICS